MKLHKIMAHYRHSLLPLTSLGMAMPQPTEITILEEANLEATLANWSSNLSNVEIEQVSTYENPLSKNDSGVLIAQLTRNKLIGTNQSVTTEKLQTMYSSTFKISSMVYGGIAYPLLLKVIYNSAQSSAVQALLFKKEHSSEHIITYKDLYLPYKLKEVK